jgi:hypothetical protein
MSCNKLLHSGKCRCRDRNSRENVSIEKWKATRKRLHSTQSNLVAEFLEDRVGWVYIYGKERSFIGYIEITGRGYEVPLERHTEVYDHLFRAEEVLYGWLKNERLLYE